jgi:hypothetical protein
MIAPTSGSSPSTIPVAVTPSVKRESSQIAAAMPPKKERQASSWTVLAMFAQIRHASSLLSSLAAERRQATTGAELSRALAKQVIAELGNVGVVGLRRV